MNHSRLSAKFGSLRAGRARRRGRVCQEARASRPDAGDAGRHAAPVRGHAGRRALCCASRARGRPRRPPRRPRRRRRLGGRPGRALEQARGAAGRGAPQRPCTLRIIRAVCVRTGSAAASAMLPERAGLIALAASARQHGGRLHQMADDCTKRPLRARRGKARRLRQ